MYYFLHSKIFPLVQVKTAKTLHRSCFDITTSNNSNETKQKTGQNGQNLLYNWYKHTLLNYLCRRLGTSLYPFSDHIGWKAITFDRAVHTNMAYGAPNPCLVKWPTSTYTRNLYIIEIFQSWKWISHKIHWGRKCHSIRFSANQDVKQWHGYSRLHSQTSGNTKSIVATL